MIVDGEKIQKTSDKDSKALEVVDLEIIISSIGAAILDETNPVAKEMLKLDQEMKMNQKIRMNDEIDEINGECFQK